MSWKQQLWDEIELYKKINNELTAKICYLLLWKKKYKKARLIDWVLEDKIIKEINSMDFDFENVKEKLNEHYKNLD